MGFLFGILLAFVALGVRDAGWASERELPWAVALAALVPYVLGAAARRLYLSGRRSAALLERALVVAPLLLHVLALACFGWLATVESWTGWEISLDSWPRLRLFLGLAPYLVYQTSAIDARTRLHVPRQSLGAARAFQLRLLVSGLGIFALYLGVSSAIALVPRWQVWLEEVGLLSGAFGVFLLLGFAFSGPLLLRYAWETAPLEHGSLRTSLERLAERAGFRCRELLVWRTGAQVSNAAVIGFTRRTRFVLFSDLLLAELGPDELIAVFAHEIGHALRKHALVFASFACAIVIGAELCLRWGEVTSTLPTLLVFGGFLVFGYLSFGYLSRRFELEADLESLALVGNSSALSRALQLVTGAHAHERSSWRHFSTRDRVRFLEGVERDPRVGSRLRAVLSRWRIVAFAGFALAGTLEVHSLWRTWDADLVRVELRLGNFDRAAELAQRDDVDADLAELARMASELDDDERSTQALEERAHAALARANLERASRWLELAVFRGRADLAGVLAEVERRRAGERGGELDRLPSRWREALEALDGR